MRKLYNFSSPILLRSVALMATMVGVSSIQAQEVVKRPAPSCAKIEVSTANFMSSAVWFDGKMWQEAEPNAPYQLKITNTCAYNVLAVVALENKNIVDNQALSAETNVGRGFILESNSYYLIKSMGAANNKEGKEMPLVFKDISQEPELAQPSATNSIAKAQVRPAPIKALFYKEAQAPIVPVKENAESDKGDKESKENNEDKARDKSIPSKASTNVEPKEGEPPLAKEVRIKNAPKERSVFSTEVPEDTEGEDKASSKNKSAAGKPKFSMPREIKAAPLSVSQGSGGLFSGLFGKKVETLTFKPESTTPFSTQEIYYDSRENLVQMGAYK